MRGDGPAFPREESRAFKRWKEQMGACGVILLPSEEEEISVGMERSGMPWSGWPDMTGRTESSCWLLK